MEQKYSSNSVSPEFFEMQQIQIEGKDKIVQNSCTKKWKCIKRLHLLKGNIYYSCFDPRHNVCSHGAFNTINLLGVREARESI